MNEQSILVSFVSVLLAAVDLLEQEKDKLVNQHVRLDNESCRLYEEVADLYKIMSYDLENNNPTSDKIEFAQLCLQIENLLRTIVQHSRGCVTQSNGYFHASQHNLQQLCDDSLKALEATNSKEPIEFIEIR